MYGAESEALAALEVLAHLSSFAQMPDYVCVKARIPDDLILDVRDIASLPSDWRSGDPIMARMLGTRWIADQRSPVLRVPSVFGDHYRALCTLHGDKMTWVWIGTHADYDRLSKS